MKQRKSWTPDQVLPYLFDNRSQLSDMAEIVLMNLHGPRWTQEEVNQVCRVILDLRKTLSRLSHAHVGVITAFETWMHMCIAVNDQALYDEIMQDAYGQQIMQGQMSPFRRSIELSESDQEILQEVFDLDDL